MSADSGLRPNDDRIAAMVRQYEVERFYYDEAALLDAHRYEEWLALFSDDAHYFMPIRRTRMQRELNKEFTQPGEMAFFHDDKTLLAGRVAKLKSGRSWAEDPPSRTRHLITNVRVVRDNGRELEVESNFHVYRTRLNSEESSWIGSRRDLLRRVEGSFQIADRKIFLEQTVLLSRNLSNFSEMGWLENKVALVTGGASGLGRAIVERFVDEGARVAILDRARERSEELANQLGDRVAAIVGDVTDLGDNQRAVAETIRKFGQLDCFVGNAGIWDFSISLAALPDDRIGNAFDELFGVNVKGYLLGAKAAYRELAKTNGSIIFTVSNAGFYPCGGGPLYTASKHAVVGLIRQLAYELAPKIRVNGVAPGAIPTDLRGPRSLDMGEQSIASVPLKAAVERGIPLGKLPEPRDYTGSYVLLASAENSSTATGGVILCEGGIGIRGFTDAAGGRNL